MKRFEGWFERHLNHDILYVGDTREGPKQGKLVRFKVTETTKINGHIKGFKAVCRVQMGEIVFPVKVQLDQLRGCATCKTDSADD